MTLIATDTDGAGCMADVIWVDGEPETRRFHVDPVGDVDAGVINWINADLVTHICPRG